MITRSISKAVVISAIAIVGTGAAHAQSSVQCTLGPNGQLEAALVWRNTLGTERADALCRTAPVPVAQQQTQRPAIVASVHQQSAQYLYPVQPTAAVGAMPAYQAAAPQNPPPVAPVASQSVQYQYAGVQVASKPVVAPAYPAVAAQQRYQPPMAAAPVQHQPPAAMFGSGATASFNPADYEPMQVRGVAGIQPSSPEFVPMF
ncbi:hypothetical protein [Giesbergeria anulus]|uniref:Uncharacterized protein n=1 Tax=Giesbergeria anulus TaxID=180197 RepID=A0A1H9NF87_9BURK|nr:hypothetical protein [Giesbergeria anulus]SER34558.1 hypothetical protein SAMN02982919_02195 [Giesbergeria anulus]